MEEQRCLYSSPLLEIGLYDCRRRASGPGAEEWSPRPELALPLRGAFVKHAGGRQVTCDVTTAAAFNPGETYRVSHPGDAGDLCLVLAPSGPDLRELVSEGRREPPELPFETPAIPLRGGDALRVRLLRRALGVAGERETVEELAAELLSSLTSSPARAPARGPARPVTREAQRTLAEAVRRLLRERPGEPVSLSLVARRVGTTPFHLARVFRRETGWSVRGYAMRLRLYAVLDRLGGAGVDLSGLAAELGFADHSHLTRRFRAAFGTTPSRFKRRLAAIGGRARREVAPGPSTFDSP